MADLLNQPWILNSASKFLIDEKNSFHFPKLAQLSRIVSFTGSRDEQIKVILSDNFHSVEATIPKIESGHSILQRIGIILRLEVAQWMIIPGINYSLQLQVEQYTVLDGDDANTYGNPKLLLEVPALMVLLRRRQGSIGKLEKASGINNQIGGTPDLLDQLLECLYEQPIWLKDEDQDSYSTGEDKEGYNKDKDKEGCDNHNRDSHYKENYNNLDNLDNLDNLNNLNNLNNMDQSKQPTTPESLFSYFDSIIPMTLAAVQYETWPL